MYYKLSKGVKSGDLFLQSYNLIADVHFPDDRERDLIILKALNTAYLGRYRPEENDAYAMIQKAYDMAKTVTAK